MNTDELLAYIWKHVPDHEYPLQIMYHDGDVTVQYEPALCAVLQGEGSTISGAAQELIGELVARGVWIDD